jgi:hypothetical protein
MSFLGRESFESLVRAVLRSAPQTLQQSFVKPADQPVFFEFDPAAAAGSHPPVRVHAEVQGIQVTTQAASFLRGSVFLETDDDALLCLTTREALDLSAGLLLAALAAQLDAAA